MKMSLLDNSKCYFLTNKKENNIGPTSVVNISYFCNNIYCGVGTWVILHESCQTEIPET